MSNETMRRAIAQAEQHIAQHAPEVAANAKMRQRYHFMAPCGWINDPNGLIYFRGQYHFFYQFNPYSGFWSMMHWGHAVSDDLLHWKHLPIALAPSESYDNHPQGGCFSGSAIEKDGRLYLMYTGTANNGNGFEQTQNIAYSDDGINFIKYEGNPVIEPPEGVPHDFFRDPKVWEHDGQYYVVIGSQKDGRAQALLYRSEDLLHWEFVNVLFESRGEWGFMWECPDFFPLADKWVFLCSPMGAGERTTVYFVGDFDYETGRFTYTVTGEADWGFDFYAPQTFTDASGRRIMVGWANCWDWMPFWKDWGPTYREGWCGSFAVPREVTLADDLTLRIVPVRELGTIRTPDGTDANMLTLADGAETVLHAGDGVSCELQFVIDLASTSAQRIELTVRRGEPETDGTVLRTIFTIDLQHGWSTIDRTESDDWSRGVSRAPLRLSPDKRELSVDVLLDQSSLELFLDEGAVAQSMNIFAPTSANDITVRAIGGTATLLNVHGYQVENISE
ncbi:sucrose-6-phosphate hydrolase [Bifidobacterium goeldii]|uniref:beta-fructofuranosidase n=1 Tax=Bifidobacterium goeldii TaxID=2306975 RepID=A0A430FL99_9BIFI|nr:glycoside hydrolase family 32 protein [Bifidobacterium goeldii]RSX53532.1 sucrose-6-phosphate hydrolase [Bifidobacterium goeldii]